MRTIGLTGGVGMGKSTTADYLRQRGFPVIDTDLLARELVEPGQAARSEIARVFGQAILGPDGRLDREALAQVVFPDVTLRKRLEEILHPRIREQWQAQVRDLARAGLPSAVVVIPLLFETGAESSLDLILCVACSAATQQARLLARGWSMAQIEQRIAAQWSIEKKMELSHYVIWTESGLALHESQLDLILSRAGLTPAS
jgi:dephospho-CoA kinase